MQSHEHQNYGLASIPVNYHILGSLAN